FSGFSPNHCICETVETAGYNVGIGIRFLGGGSVQWATSGNYINNGRWYDADSTGVIPGNYEVKFTETKSDGSIVDHGWDSLGSTTLYINQETLSINIGSVWIVGNISIRNKLTGEVLVTQDIRATNSRMP